MLRESVLVPKIGVEPIRCFHRGILSPLRLPIPPFRHIKLLSVRNICVAVFARTPG